jgi:hypothetical protein
MTNAPSSTAADPTVRSRRWTVSAILAAAFAVAWLTVQLAIPAFALLEPRPARLGWQMYSGLATVPEAWTVGADGRAAAVDVQALFVVPRSEIDYVAVLRDGLCDVTDAVAIIVRPQGTTGWEQRPCR